MLLPSKCNKQDSLYDEWLVTPHSESVTSAVDEKYIIKLLLTA